MDQKERVMAMSEYKYDFTETINQTFLEMCPDDLRHDFERVVAIANKYGLTLPSLMGLLKETSELVRIMYKEDEEKKGESNNDKADS